MHSVHTQGTQTARTLRAHCAQAARTASCHGALGAMSWLVGRRIIIPLLPCGRRLLSCRCAHACAGALCRCAHACAGALCRCAHACAGALCRCAHACAGAPCLSFPLSRYKNYLMTQNPCRAHSAVSQCCFVACTGRVVSRVTCCALHCVIAPWS